MLRIDKVIHSPSESVMLPAPTRGAFAFQFKFTRTGKAYANLLTGTNDEKWPLFYVACGLKNIHIGYHCGEWVEKWIPAGELPPGSVIRGSYFDQKLTIWLNDKEIYSTPADISFIYFWNIGPHPQMMGGTRYGEVNVWDLTVSGEPITDPLRFIPENSQLDVALSPDLIHVLSLGGGVQSSTLALLAKHKEVTPMPTACIFADTQAESKVIYEWLDWLKEQLPYPTHIVTAGSLEKELLTKPKGILPHFEQGAKGLARGGRLCTTKFKIEPIWKFEEELIGPEKMAAWVKKHQAAMDEIIFWQNEVANGNQAMRPWKAWAECQADPLMVCWIGISYDEISRMNESLKPWLLHRWPLVELEMTRADCIAWMEAHGYPKPKRSSCVFCPYKDDVGWQEIKAERPDEFARAVEFERQYQAGTTPVPYLHSSLVPLEKADFSNGVRPINRFNEECKGMCGV